MEGNKLHLGDAVSRAHQQGAWDTLSQCNGTRLLEDLNGDKPSPARRQLGSVCHPIHSGAVY